MVQFDEAVGLTLELMSKHISNVARAHLVRDTMGSLTVVLPDDALPAGEWANLAQRLDEALRPYSSGPRRVLLPESELIDSEQVFESEDKILLSAPDVWLVDQLLTNQDWIRKPIRNKPRIPTAVAFSVKGGVGRSTALAMCAWYFARKALDVLVVDLDLEAPGIGSILLAEPPEHGLIDWLMEEMNGQGTVELLAAALKESPISHGEDGRVRVLAAHGRLAPNYIAKLGRIFAPTVLADGCIEGLAERLDKLLGCIGELADPPDVILVDSRAGMHDIGSAAVTRLGAEVFMFARNDSQDWWAYERLFDYLRHAPSVSGGMGNDIDLRWKLKMIAAQTPPREDARREYLDNSYRIWNGFYDDETAAEEGSRKFDPHVFDRDDVEAPHYPLFINFDVGVRGLSLVNAAARPEWGFVEGIFRDFFQGVEQRLLPDAISETEGGTT
jgi:cellulose biosynthesis protein BcsQ